MIFHEIRKESLSLWKAWVGSGVLFQRPQEKPEIPFLSVTLLPGILHLKGPKFQKPPQGAWDITDVNICKNPFCLGADGNLHPTTQVEGPDI